MRVLGCFVWRYVVVITQDDIDAMGGGTRKGGWMATASGGKFWPIDPRPEDVFIEDIAHALSMICRFGGHCQRFYSVAEHSVLVSHAVDHNDALWGLLHDASEAYISDIVKPAKPFIEGYKAVEDSIMGAVCERFGLPKAAPRGLKIADWAILGDEARELMDPFPHDWHLPEPTTGLKVVGHNPDIAKGMFIDRYVDITRATVQRNTDKL